MLAVGGRVRDGGDTPKAEVVDTAGVRTVSCNLADVSVPTYRMIGAHDLQVGMADGPPEYTFSRIPDLALAGDGSIIVSDGVAQELRLYDANGTYLRTIGQGGEGAGEFATAPLISGLAGDTVFAFDSRSSRVTSYTTGGELIEMATLRTEAIGRPPFLIRQDDGTYLVQSHWRAPSEKMSFYDIRLDFDSIVVMRLDTAGELIDTIRVMADRNRARMVSDRGNGVIRTIQAEPPYTVRAFIRSDGVRPIIGHSDSFKLDLTSFAGGAPTYLRVLGVDHPATADEIRVRQERAVREAAGEGEIDPLTWKLNVEFLPDHLPAFADIVVSDDGDVWVALMEYNRSEGYDWLVFTPSAELRGVVRTPPEFQLFEIRSDFVVGVYRDDFDVPYVRRYPLLPAPMEEVEARALRAR